MVAAQLSDGAADVRTLAQAAIARTKIRQALESCARLAELQGYSDQATLGAVERLAQISDVDVPYLATLKGLGLQAAKAGQVDRAMDLLQGTVSRAIAAGQRRDSKSRQAMRFTYDPEIGGAIQLLARQFSGPNTEPKARSPLRLVVVSSGLQDEDAPSIVTLKRSVAFRQAGFEIEIVSTELGNSNGTAMLSKALAVGIPFTPIPPGTWRQRVAWTTNFFAANAADAVMYEASGMDLFAQLLAAIRMAPVQVWGNKGFEPQAGAYEIVAQNLSPNQERETRWPGVSKFYGAAIALADEIDAAVPFERAELNLPSDAIVLGTFGRTEKCISDTYIQALSEILRSDPRTQLLLAGPDNLKQIELILERFNAAGVRDRVHYLGRRQSDAARLVKTLDIYCDTHPWPGGQSLQDAMQAGVPIVAMRKPSGSTLDANGVSVSEVADVLLGGLVELADSGDVASYVRIALALAADGELRRHVGARVREKAVTQCSLRVSTDKLAADMMELIERRRPALNV